MMDPRHLQLARQLAGFSTDVRKGDNVLIDASGIPEEMVLALVRGVREKGGAPQVQLNQGRVLRELIAHGTDAEFRLHARHELARMKSMQAYIAFRGSDNIFESSDVPADRMQAYLKATKPVIDHRVRRTRWCVLRWPTPSMAQQARMSTEAFADFYFRVCLLDYARMKPGMAALKRRMERTREVHIEGPETDLRFSIEGIPAVTCGGNFNVPDGEVFTAPVRDSVEGYIAFNAPTIYRGKSFDQIRLGFRKGRVVEATASDTDALNEILDSDPGARRIGEFALGFNPHILEPMRDILFDEKIAGSFHFTPGQAYEEADNGNRSAVHWDMVSIQRPEYGGGTIAFDGKVIRRDGLFLPKDLQKLNPDYLLGT